MEHPLLYKERDASAECERGEVKNRRHDYLTRLARPAAAVLDSPPSPCKGEGFYNYVFISFSVILTSRQCRSRG